MINQITTKMRITKPTNEVFEAIVDPAKIGKFWFSSSSQRWIQGQKVTLRYEEYNAEVVIHVVEVEENKKIVYSWGEEQNEETQVTIVLKEWDNQSTIIEITESGFREEDPDVISKVIGQKEGWVYMLCCLKCYLENDVKELRASLIH